MPKLKLSGHDWGFLVLLVYLSFLNLRFLRSSPEVIFVQFAILVFIFYAKRFSNFAREWLPAVGLFVAFEFSRGIADDFAPFYEQVRLWVYKLELAIFGQLPTQWLQARFDQGSSVVAVSFFFYSMFFYFSFLVGLMLWLYRHKLFREYFFRFLLMSFAGVLVFWLIPTAPPWLVDEEIGLGITRYIYKSAILTKMSGMTIYGYFVYNNAEAALPSLHTAWPAFTAMFLGKRLKSKWWYGLLVIPAMIGFSVVLTAEHYIIDVALGFLMGIAFAVSPIPEKIVKRLRL